MKFKRIFLLVLDSLGVGEADDALEYGDIGANTLKHIIEGYPIKIPNMKKLGFYNILGLENIETNAYYTKAKPLSNGKDTMVGHYELMGIRTVVPYRTFTETGFPEDMIKEIENKTGYKVIGNKAASGTEIIKELGKEHIDTKAIIVYTSADSVIQIAAHEEIISVNELYQICQITREISSSKDEWKVGRVIARPFIGTINNFIRTENRKDYALKPPRNTILDHLKDNGYEVISIGKIADIFDKEGITKDLKTAHNEDGLNTILEIIDKDFKGLCFINLNDFDSKYGHRRDVAGYAKCLEQFDLHLPLILNKLKSNDLLIITADHGTDPTHHGTDHTRENIPVVIYSKSFNNNKQLPTLDTFADIGASVADNFQVQKPDIGNSFLDQLN